MGTRFIQFLSPVIISPFPPSKTNPSLNLSLNARFSIGNNHHRRWCCTTNGYLGGGSRWYSNPTEDNTTVRNENLDFNLDDDDDEIDGDDDEEAFGFRSAAKSKRNWWSESDDSFFDDDDDDDDEDEFGGVLEGSIGGIASISKVFRAFGWMVPAIVISMLVGTGPNAFLMALAIPLAQSALSLVVDTLWSSPNDNPRPKPRTKRRPFARAASTVGTSKAREGKTGNEASVNKGKRNTSNFGGWDELDKQGRTNKVPFMTRTRRSNEQSQQKKGKLSRNVRNTEKPLVQRLLIAMFPFLGSWTKFL